MNTLILEEGHRLLFIAMTDMYLDRAAGESQY